MADIKFSALPAMSTLGGTEKLVGLQSGVAEVATPAQLNTYVLGLMGTGVAAALGIGVGGAGSFVVNGGALGTPSSGVATNLTGTAAGLTAGNVTTNANMTGDVTSVGNATTIATVNANVGAFTNANITVNAKGQVTAAANGAGGAGGDYLSTLTAATIAVSGAATATISRQHYCTGTSYTLTLPAASGNTDKFLSIVCQVSGRLTVDGNGSETIDGALTRIMWLGESCVLYCNGSGWFKIAGKSLPMLCTMRLSANQTGVVSSVVTKCLLDQIDVDSAGMGNTGSTRIDIKRPGLYRVFGAPIFDGLTAPATRIFTVFALTTVTLPIEPEISASAGCFPSPFGSVLTPPVTTSDYMELAGFQNQGSNGAFYGSASGSATALTVEEVQIW